MYRRVGPKERSEILGLLIEIAAELDMTPHALSRLVGTSTPKPAYSWFKGESVPSPLFALRLARAVMHKMRAERSGEDREALIRRLEQERLHRSREAQIMALVTGERSQPIRKNGESRRTQFRLEGSSTAPAVSTKGAPSGGQ